MACANSNSAPVVANATTATLFLPTANCKLSAANSRADDGDARRLQSIATGPRVPPEGPPRVAPNIGSDSTRSVANRPEARKGGDSPRPIAGARLRGPVLRQPKAGG